MRARRGAPDPAVLQAQLLVDPKQQLVEDYRKPWDEERFPFETIATVRIPRQDPSVRNRITFWEDRACKRTKRG